LILLGTGEASKVALLAGRGHDMSGKVLQVSHFAKAAAARKRRAWPNLTFNS
jgi:hypothetical protein